MIKASLTPSCPTQLPSNANYLIYLVKNRLWKSLRMVSFTNLFFVSGSVLACPLKTTSSFHLLASSNRVWTADHKISCVVYACRSKVQPLDQFPNMPPRHKHIRLIARKSKPWQHVHHSRSATTPSTGFGTRLALLVSEVLTFF